jgi:hypothetical protein
LGILLLVAWEGKEEKKKEKEKKKSIATSPSAPSSFR